MSVSIGSEEESEKENQAKKEKAEKKEKKEENVCWKEKEELEAKIEDRRFLRGSPTKKSKSPSKKQDKDKNRYVRNSKDDNNI